MKSVTNDNFTVDCLPNSCSAGAALVFILETMWVAALFIDLLCRRGEYTMKLRCWDFMRWSCGRARAPFYACVATAILFANLTVLATVSGKTYDFIIIILLFSSNEYVLLIMHCKNAQFLNVFKIDIHIACLCPKHTSTVIIYWYYHCRVGWLHRLIWGY